MSPCHPTGGSSENHRLKSAEKKGGYDRICDRSQDPRNLQQDPLNGPLNLSIQYL